MGSCPGCPRELRKSCAILIASPSHDFPLFGLRLPVHLEIAQELRNPSGLAVHET